ncbi:hypothetical protein [Microbispora hainanensis]|uniref:Transmembrane transport protein n=1 Tax=Microbispora hainanensis TaxID=568844 RepID=A0A544Y5K9_9ACTN|nr:hypothetical protein [Microbispora hainanensis]TQS12049.1 hypothetical protein FLX08_36635 [Microbispora hainanensis]
MTEEPRLSARELIERLEPALSRARRIRAVTALLTGLSGTVFMAALWGGEPGPLPGRTQAMFALLTAVCLAWAGYGGWLLMRRVPLFAADRVIAAWIALAASLVTTAALAVLAVRRGTGLAPVLAAGGLFVATALVLAVRAHARRAALLRRARELARAHPSPPRTHPSEN